MRLILRTLSQHHRQRGGYFCYDFVLASRPEDTVESDFSNGDAGFRILFGTRDLQHQRRDEE